MDRRMMTKGLFVIVVCGRLVTTVHSFARSFVRSFVRLFVPSFVCLACRSVGRFVVCLYLHLTVLDSVEVSLRPLLVKPFSGCGAAEREEQRTMTMG